MLYVPLPCIEIFKFLLSISISKLSKCDIRPWTDNGAIYAPLSVLFGNFPKIFVVIFELISLIQIQQFNNNIIMKTFKWKIKEVWFVFKLNDIVIKCFCNIWFEVQSIRNWFKIIRIKQKYFSFFSYFSIRHSINSFHLVEHCTWHSLFHNMYNMEKNVMLWKKKKKLYVIARSIFCILKNNLLNKPSRQQNTIYSNTAERNTMHIKKIL